MRFIDQQHRVFKEASRYFEEAKEIHRQFISGAEATDALLTSVLRLAHLDSAYRSHGAHFDIAAMRRIDPKDVEDLWRLASLVDSAKFKASTACYLNPTFGGASGLVGGADCDILIDHRLIEIKTIGKPYLPPDAWHQLIGYYLLLRLGGIHCDGSSAIDYAPKVVRIDAAEVYMSRFGQLQSIPLDDLISEEDFESFARWLIIYLTERDPHCARHLSNCQTLDAVDWLRGLRVPRPERRS